MNRDCRERAGVACQDPLRIQLLHSDWTVFRGAADTIHVPPVVTVTRIQGAMVQGDGIQTPSMGPVEQWNSGQLSRPCENPFRIVARGNVLTLILEKHMSYYSTIWQRPV